MIAILLEPDFYRFQSDTQTPERHERITTQPLPALLRFATQPPLRGRAIPGAPWWVTHNEHGAFEARGIHGQRLYIAPAAELVVAGFASHPVASSVANDPISVPGLLALGRLLGHR